MRRSTSCAGLDEPAVMSTMCIWTGCVLHRHQELRRPGPNTCTPMLITHPDSPVTRVWVQRSSHGLPQESSPGETSDPTLTCASQCRVWFGLPLEQLMYTLVGSAAWSVWSQSHIAHEPTGYTSWPSQPATDPVHMHSSGCHGPIEVTPKSPSDSPQPKLISFPQKVCLFLCACLCKHWIVWVGYTCYWWPITQS